MIQAKRTRQGTGGGGSVHMRLRPSDEKPVKDDERAQPLLDSGGPAGNPVNPAREPVKNPVMEGAAKTPARRSAAKA